MSERKELRILILEDQMGHILFIREELRKEFPNATVIFVKSLQEARDSYSDKLNLIIADMQVYKDNDHAGTLPKGGMEFLIEVREKNKNIPLIAYSVWDKIDLEPNLSMVNGQFLRKYGTNNDKNALINIVKKVLKLPETIN